MRRRSALGRGSRRPACTPGSDRHEGAPRVRPLQATLDGAAHGLGVRRARAAALGVRRARRGRVQAAHGPPLPAPRAGRRSGHAVGRRGRPAHPAGPEHRRGLAGRRPADRAQDRPDARRARGQQALHRRRGRGLQRRVEPGAAGPPVVRRVPARLGARPCPAPRARLPGRAARRRVQHERGLQPRGHPPAQRAVVPRRHGRRVRLVAGVHGGRRAARSRASARSTSRPASRTR